MKRVIEDYTFNMLLERIESKLNGCHGKLLDYGYSEEMLIEGINSFLRNYNLITASEEENQLLDELLDDISELEEMINDEI